MDDLEKALLGKIEKETEVLVFYYVRPRRPWSPVGATSRFTRDFGPPSDISKNDSLERGMGVDLNIEDDEANLEYLLSEVMSKDARMGVEAFREVTFLPMFSYPREVNEVIDKKIYFCCRCRAELGYLVVKVDAEFPVEAKINVIVEVVVAEVILPTGLL
ncbi:hypothetical protein V6N13_041691 [Hibiscus sabdariffa]